MKKHYWYIPYIGGKTIKNDGLVKAIVFREKRVLIFDTLNRHFVSDDFFGYFVAFGVGLFFSVLSIFAPYGLIFVSAPFLIVSIPGMLINVIRGFSKRSTIKKYKILIRVQIGAWSYYSVMTEFTEKSLYGEIDRVYENGWYNFTKNSFIYENMQRRIEENAALSTIVKENDFDDNKIRNSYKKMMRKYEKEVFDNLGW